ncbi:MAG: hypothetical protein PHI18_03810 [bacterium]|nr:hypothetical protein [bacterium]
MKYTRQNILEALLEPLDTVDGDLLVQAELLAANDADVARALKECRRWNIVSSESVLAAPVSTDAMFLTAVRERIERAQSPKRARGVFGSARLILSSATVGVMLIAAVLSLRIWRPGGAPSLLTDSPVADYAAVTDPVAVLDMETLAASEVPAETLAVYLDVASVTEVWESNAANSQPLTDVLLSLESQDLVEVISELEATHFF